MRAVDGVGRRRPGRSGRPAARPGCRWAAAIRSVAATSAVVRGRTTATGVPDAHRSASSRWYERSRSGSVSTVPAGRAARSSATTVRRAHIWQASPHALRRPARLARPGAAVVAPGQRRVVRRAARVRGAAGRAAAGLRPGPLRPAGRAVPPWRCGSARSLVPSREMLRPARRRRPAPPQAPAARPASSGGLDRGVGRGSSQRRPARRRCCAGPPPPSGRAAPACGTASGRSSRLRRTAARPACEGGVGDVRVLPPDRAPCTRQ